MNNEFEDIAKKISNLVNEKNKSYGNSFEQTEEFIKMLYPNGIKKEQYLNFLFAIRMFDKLKRVSTQKDAFKENPFLDMFGLIVRRISNESNEDV